MSMNAIMQRVELCIQAKQPVLLWGPPGVGKTAAVNALGDKLGMPVVTVIASIREPSDFAGLPVVRPEGVEFAPPTWAKQLLTYQRAILFLDEITLAPRAVQAALLRVVLERVCGDVYLGDEIAIVCAANPPEMSAGGIQLTGPLGNRVNHDEFTVDVEGWCEGMAVGRFGKGHVSRDHERAATLVSSFMRRNASALFRYPKSSAELGRAWPSPRSWDAAHRLLATCYANGLDVKDDTTVQLITGAVGETGQEFIRWAIDMDLPDPEEMLKNPDKVSLPQRGDKLVVAAISAAVAAIRKLDDKKQVRDRWLACWTLYTRICDERGIDHTIDGARILAKHMPEYTTIPQLASKKFSAVFTKAGIMGGAT